MQADGRVYFQESLGNAVGTLLAKLCNKSISEHMQARAKALT